MAAPSKQGKHPHLKYCCGCLLRNVYFLWIFALLLPGPQPASGVDMSIILPPVCDREREEPKINTAVLTIKNDDALDAGSNLPVVVYLQTEECYECDLIPVQTVNTTCAFRVDTRWPTKLEIRQLKGTDILKATNSCSVEALSQAFTEGGEYTIFISSAQDEDVDMECKSVTMSNPPDPFIPIYVAMSILLCLPILWHAMKYLYKRGYIHRICCFWSTESMMADLGSPTNINQIDDSTLSSETHQTPPSTRERLKSLDTLRGFSIVIMIFVNYGGGRYWFFAHSKWNGLTVADLVFPWFVFIMGTALAMSFQSQIRRGTPKWKMFAKIVKRSITLFLLGLLINSFGVRNGVEFETLRIPGVLQRFAGTYLVTASVYLFLAPQYIPNQSCKFPSLRDLTLFWPEWLVNLAFVGVHLAITMAMPVPGCPSGYLGPGGLEQHEKYFYCTGGAAGYIDREFFGSAHIYQHPTSMEVYNSVTPYDPEGLLGTLNSCVLCFLGLQAGKILMVFTDWVQRTRRFFIWSLVLGVLGILLCEGSLNDGWIPINKNLWSLSFICILSAMAFFLLMVLYIVIDVYKLWSGAPFTFAGMNAIALYCGHEFFSGRAPVYFAVPDTHAALIAINLWGTAFWVLVSVYFYYNNIFISV